jgi:NAD-dependent dihydropyrimidine dehydrogenase PreA subunit
MAHTIVTNVCEGVADCVDACPVACINPGKGANSKGTAFYWIDFDTAKPAPSGTRATGWR